ncbi:hypothetical protein P280DRAFT_483381 [Massarina eburnea CBS 473.64]|uniref:DUF6697 domain-containing protein n=1 Tax=Massarina eburnea CBS 473.64 TaxID=1395130 RepID=A0A6A6RM87_9PLEO|nr:hypothetical protein P280DRAFT_483381 [Massarina eburnea CBS 473.64]
MSSQDPLSHRPARSGYSTYQPPGRVNNDPSQVSSHSPSTSTLDSTINTLKTEQQALRTDVEDLKTLSNSLYASVESLKRGGWEVTVGPFKDQATAEFKRNLDIISREARSVGRLYDGANEYQQSNSSVPPHLRGGSDSVKSSSASTSVPPHLRNKSVSVPPHLRGKTSVPPHLRNKDTSSGTSASASTANNPLVTDGPVDTLDSQTPTQKDPAISTADLTPPASPTLKAGGVAASSSPEDDKWVPHFIKTLAPFTKVPIPSLESMVSFAPDFLRNVIGGSEWSPGLIFIEPNSTYCMLPNRCYYTLDKSIDPFVPSTPGAHGAKLVPFFNTQPEESFTLNYTSETGTSTEKVALFTLLPDPRHGGKKRYYYMGHYSQTRWSDKLDYERMIQCVPQNVREYWACELSAAGRPEWLSKELLQHFFPKPTYEGRMPGIPEEEGGSVVSGDAEQRDDKVSRDIRKYIGELRAWEKEYTMRTSLIRKEFVMEAFDRADADDPQALRLYWEYLECVDWKADFYDMFSTLQGRNPTYDRY